MLCLLPALLLAGCHAAAAPEGRSGAREGNSVVRAGATYVASTTLSFSNVRLAIEETLTKLSPWRSNRILVLTSPAGEQRRIPLSSLTNGGGSISLYALQEGYVLIGQNDCIAVDDVRLTTRSCLSAGADQRCEARRQPNGILRRAGGGRWPIYLGRFDWMNGFDPPDGRFGYAFRYQSLEHAWESPPDCP